MKLATAYDSLRQSALASDNRDTIFIHISHNASVSKTIFMMMTVHLQCTKKTHARASFRREGRVYKKERKIRRGVQGWKRDGGGEGGGGAPKWPRNESSRIFEKRCVFNDA